MLEALIPSGFTIFVVALAFVAIVIIRTGVKQVPSTQELTLEWFGKYSRTMQPGLNLIIPFVEKVASKRSSFDGGSDDTAVGHQDDENSF